MGKEAVMKENETENGWRERKKSLFIQERLTGLT